MAKEKECTTPVDHKVAELSENLFIDSKVNSIAHGHAAEYWGGAYLFLGLTITTLSAIVSASIFSEFAELEIAGAILSLFLVVLSAVSTFLNPDQRTNAHMTAKALYGKIAHGAITLFNVNLTLRKNPVDKLCDTYERLVNEYNEAEKNSPRLPNRHANRAKKDFQATYQKKVQSEKPAKKVAQ